MGHEPRISFTSLILPTTHGNDQKVEEPDGSTLELQN